jgi:hypothetical protein
MELQCEFQTQTYTFSIGEVTIFHGTNEADKRIVFDGLLHFLWVTGDTDVRLLLGVISR